MYITKLEAIVLCFVIFIYIDTYLKYKETVYKSTYRKCLFLFLGIFNVAIIFVKWLP